MPFLSSCSNCDKTGVGVGVGPGVLGVVVTVGSGSLVGVGLGVIVGSTTFSIGGRSPLQADRPKDKDPRERRAPKSRVTCLVLKKLREFRTDG